MSFEKAFTFEAARIREELQKSDTITHFRLVAEAEGRVHNGHLKLRYSITKEYGAESVTGNDVQAVLIEFMRRHGWTMENCPAELTYDPEPF